MPGNQLPQRTSDVSERKVGRHVERHDFVLKDKAQTVLFRFSGLVELHRYGSIEASAGENGGQCLSSFHRVLVLGGGGLD